MTADKRVSTLALLAVTVVAVAGVAAVWSGLSLVLRSGCGWMAAVTALDAVLLLHLANVAPGARRAAWAVAITALTVVAAWYLVAAAQIGLPMGYRPADAVWKISPGLAWLYTRSNLGALDLLWLGLAVAAAWTLGAWRGGKTAH